MILVTSSNWINCSFSRPSKVRMSFCQIAAKFFFFKFKICQTVARHKDDQSISQKFFCCLSLTNYLISKLRLATALYRSHVHHCAAFTVQPWFNKYALEPKFWSGNMGVYKMLWSFTGKYLYSSLWCCKLKYLRNLRTKFS